jgi:membrane dipeptidase
MPRFVRYAALLVLLGPVPAFAQADDLAARAKAIQARIMTVDTHVDIPFNFATDAYDMMKPGPRGQQVHLPTMIAGGLDAPFLIVYVGQGDRNTAGYAKALSDAFTKVSAIHKLAEQLHPDKIEIATTATDARRIHAAGKKVALIGMENGFPIGKDLRLLDQFYDYGVRYFGLLHNGHNDLGDSAQPDRRKNEPSAEWNGLSPLGKQVVKRLNELGIMVDVSHASDKATLDAIAASTAPVIASHSAVNGVSLHARNLSDPALEGIGRSGGVVQIVAFDPYLRVVPTEKTEAIAALDKEMGVSGPGSLQRLPADQVAAYDARMAEIHKKWPKATVRDLVDHIDYAVKKIGVDHVGIASDFNGGGGIDGWNSAAETFNVTMELVRRGYTEEQIAKIWGGNILRVMDRARQHALELKQRK